MAAVLKKKQFKEPRTQASDFFRSLFSRRVPRSDIFLGNWRLRRPFHRASLTQNLQYHQSAHGDLRLRRWSEQSTGTLENNSSVAIQAATQLLARAAGQLELHRHREGMDYLAQRGMDDPKLIEELGAYSGARRSRVRSHPDQQSEVMPIRNSI